MSNPVLVEVTRGAQVESRHRGAIAISDPEGRLVLSLGDVGRLIFPRSAIKAFQALPLVESGLAERLGLTNEEIALTCASHNGEPAHVATALAMLARVGRDGEALECGAHWPLRQDAANALVAAGERPRAVHNNCSGKHAGFVCLACGEGRDPEGYIAAGHPTMRAVMQAVSDMTGAPISEALTGIDGCSIPTQAASLEGLARGFARFATGAHLGPERARAAARIREAVAAAPFMVAGTDHFDTEIMELFGARVFVKTGAEGVYCAAFPELGLGMALKCDDGATRAARVMTAAVIARILPLSETEGAALARFIRPVQHNWNGLLTGGLRPASVLAEGLPDLPAAP